VSLIDEALKRAQATDKLAGAPPSAWTPTHLPDRHPRRYRAIGWGSVLLLSGLTAWIVIHTLRGQAAPSANSSRLPAAVPSPAPLRAPEPRTSGAQVDFANSDSAGAKSAPAPAMASGSGSGTAAARAAAPAESAQPAPAKRIANEHAIEKLIDGRSYTGEIPLADGAKIVLDGIVYSDANPVALINGQVVRPGGLVGGMTVAKIEPDRVRLDGGGVSVFLLLK
jgi:hypothetical protein